MIKKSKKVFSTLLTFTILVSGISNEAYAKIARSNDNIILNAVSLVDENSINLNWNVDNPTQPFNFKVMKKRADETEYSTLGMGEHKEKVTVLNFYPDDSSIPIDTSFTTWNGEYVEGLPRSAKLKRWMEEPNNEDSKGYGKGVIEVIPISISEFNNSPNSFCVKNDDEYYVMCNGENKKIDVIMIGNWDDSMAISPISSEGVSILQSYIEDGGSVIFGHDIIYKNYSTSIFSQYLDMRLNNPYNSLHNIYGDSIQTVKKGMILEKPWLISEDNLNIPLTHSTNQLVKRENIWIDFNNPKEGQIEENQGYTNNHYLTIKNNLAMIQAGHSRGQATPDEQKILANTIFYMSQVSSTEGTTFVDSMGQDVSAPEKPAISNVDIDIDNKKIIFNGLESEDIGTDYSYYIEGTGKNDGIVVSSNIVNVNIKKGLKGYSYIIDTNPNGVPDNEIDVESIANGFEYNFNSNNIGQYYLHIKAVDNSGNFSETTHVKLSSLNHELAACNLEIAELNPTSTNISIAREAINNLPESFVKDELQDKLNSLSTTDTLERKSATGNLDVYIKSQNMLSMSLDTNSITFDGYSGTEDMEMLSAVNISINSSLPYSLNAYLPSEIVNSDKSETMPIDVLNIREESEGMYQTFTDTTSKIVLKDNCVKGNGLLHGIDLKLASNLAHKADVYKTTLKFEVEQK